MSLERQVRIAAGSLVLLGAVLGGFVHPGFIVVWPSWVPAWCSQESATPAEWV